MRGARERGELSVELRGRILRLDPGIEEHLEGHLKMARPPGEGVPSFSALLVADNLEKLEFAVEAPVRADEFRLRPVERPRSLGAPVRLLKHQAHGVAWLQSLAREGLPSGLLLADDMGLGKTLQVWTFLEWFREGAMAEGPALIVAPAGPVENWIVEYLRFFTGPGALDRAGLLLPPR